MTSELLDQDESPTPSAYPFYNTTVSLADCPSKSGETCTSVNNLTFASTFLHTGN